MTGDLQSGKDADPNPGSRNDSEGLRPLSGGQPLSYVALRDIIDLSLWTGQMLLQYGASSERVEETVHRLGTGLGCDWMDVHVTLKAISITTISGKDFRTKIRRVVRLRTDFWKITFLNDLGRQVSDGRLDRFQVRAELEKIDQSTSRYNRWLVLGAVALACAAFGRLFGGDWPAFFTTFFAAGIGFLLRQQMDKAQFNPYLIAVICAFVASMIAGSADLLNLSSEPGTAIVASVIFLLPGVPLINAAQDLMKGHTANGISRGVIGLIVTLSIATGVFFTLSLTGLHLP